MEKFEKENGLKFLPTEIIDNIGSSIMGVSDFDDELKKIRATIYPCLRPRKGEHSRQDSLPTKSNSSRDVPEQSDNASLSKPSHDLAEICAEMPHWRHVSLA